MDSRLRSELAWVLEFITKVRQWIPETPDCADACHSAQEAEDRLRLILETEGYTKAPPAAKGSNHPFGRPVRCPS